VRIKGNRMATKQQNKISFDIIDRCYEEAKRNYERAREQYGNDDARTFDAELLYFYMKSMITDYDGAWKAQYYAVEALNKALDEASKAYTDAYKAYEDALKANKKVKK
jgi:hypothetical protein